MPASIGLTQVTSISLGLFRREEIGAVAAGLFEGLLATPFGDVGVIAADENFGDGPAAEIGGASVVGEVEQGAACGQSSMQLGGLGLFGALEQAEGLVLGGGFVTESAREESRDGVHDECGGKFAAAEDEIADGDFLGSKMIGDALVHAFVTAADENDAILLRVAAGGFLREAFARGGEKNDCGFFVVEIFLRGVSDGTAEERFDGFEEWLGLKDHAFAAAKGAIVHGAMTISCELAQILHVNMHEACFAGTAQDAVIERAREKFWKNRNQIKSHGLARLV